MESWRSSGFWLTVSRRTIPGGAEVASVEPSREMEVGSMKEESMEEVGTREVEEGGDSGKTMLSDSSWRGKRTAVLSRKRIKKLVNWPKLQNYFVS